MPCRASSASAVMLRVFHTVATLKLRLAPAQPLLTSRSSAIWLYAVYVTAPKFLLTIFPILTYGGACPRFRVTRAADGGASALAPAPTPEPMRPPHTLMLGPVGFRPPEARAAERFSFAFMPRRPPPFPPPFMTRFKAARLSRRYCSTRCGLRF